MCCPNIKSLQMFLPVAITPVLNLNQWDTFHIGFSETLYGQKLTWPAAGNIALIPQVVIFCFLPSI